MVASLSNCNILASEIKPTGRIGNMCKQICSETYGNGYVPRTVGRLASHPDNVLLLLLWKINVVATSDTIRSCFALIYMFSLSSTCHNTQTQ
ncbi:hypothetical protein ARALYDRAFT_896491 [Arabidopsis lyrata subsp. lyrata]|uniref:Uncharacterized protein n=1 Tax=Arabidopsis lyrata subsp. lyrata TaxID=81972 RepID=D7L270_ARALL|nr:hypothetical protein ARALYDRAFT_896491 [Arabidopsis lyrata subsp. lyrata]